MPEAAQNGKPANAKAALPAWRRLEGFDELSESWSAASSHPEATAAASSQANPKNDQVADRQPQQDDQGPGVSSDPEPSQDDVEHEDSNSTTEPAVVISEPPKGEVDFSPARRNGHLRILQTSTPPPQSRIPAHAPADLPPEPSSPSSSDAKQGHIFGGEEDREEEDVERTPRIVYVPPTDSTEQSPSRAAATSAAADATVLLNSDASSIPPILRPAWQDGSPSKDRPCLLPI